ncbi:MAG: hypothetical protein M1536_02700 [Firmicutes bacterium]|nr:hypothetical protein [Bacillota bacterium]
MKLPKLNFKTLILGGGMMAIFAVVFFAQLEHYTTSRPEFCLKCHSRQGHILFDRLSSVHPKIECNQCHGKYGEVIPVSGYRAEGDRINPNCVRCHQDIANGGEPKFKYNVMKIKIPHKFHIQDVGAKCVDCHYSIMHDRVEPPTNRPHMEACYATCHQGEEQCMKCHTEGTIVPPKAGKLTKTECSTCHLNFEGKKIKIFNKTYIHSPHLAAGLECTTCHTYAQKHGTVIITGKDCDNCHGTEKK